MRAGTSAGAATVPAILGVCFGDASMGSTASFGAYLVVVTHNELPSHDRARRLFTTVLMLSTAAQAGAAAGMRPWAFLLLAVLGAAWQAWTEVADISLRLPSAMAVLAMLVSTGNISDGRLAGMYGAVFGAGAVWQALVQYIVARRETSPNAASAAEFAALFSAAAAARRFVAVMTTLSIVAGSVALALPVPHAAWLLTTALRVMKPSQKHTLQRLKHRFVGTAGGAIFSAALLARPVPGLLRAGILGVMLTIMQLVGAQRYAAWTFCLTVIALDLGEQPDATGWQVAEYRLGLTIGGLALALLFSVCLPSAGEPWLGALRRQMRGRLRRVANHD
jgi:hypothetical protein